MSCLLTSRSRTRHKWRWTAPTGACFAVYRRFGTLRASRYTLPLSSALGAHRMPKLRINIVGFADDSFPGWVEFTLVDAEGNIHSFVDKAPVVSQKDLNANSFYPIEEAIECEVKSQAIDKLGRLVAEVSTANPWGISSKAGESTFVVLQTLLS